MKKQVSYIEGKDGSKVWTYPASADEKYKFYTLEITPFWKSSLGGNPSAIKVEAEHLDFSTETGKFEYSLIWARYITSDGTSKFGPNVSETNPNITINEINMYLDGDPETECKIIKEPLVSRSDIISIRINRNYDGIIKIHLTPIMSYGELTHLTRTIVLDLNKVPNGEIDLVEWNYSVTKSIGTITRDTASTLHTSEEIQTTTKKKQDGAAEIEIKTVNTTTKKKSENPIISTTYIHNLNFSYGFDSFMYDDQVPDDDNTKRCIKFFDLETINTHLFTLMTSLECAARIIKEYVPIHTEIIPTAVLYGGSTTVSYVLNSSECKLLPNKAYLCIFYVLSKTSSSQVFELIDYRYLFTSSIFNEQFGITRDFNDLYLPITPTLDIKFKDNNVTESYKLDNKAISLKDISDSIKWIDKNTAEINLSFTYTCKIDRTLKRIDITYDDGLFNLDYSYNPNPQLIPDADFDYVDTSAEGTQDDVIVCDKIETSLKNLIDICDIAYIFKIDRYTQMNSINIGAKFTNLLNINSSADLYNIYLSEAEGNDLTMMFEDDGIFTAGMHNNGGGNEEWFGEVGTVSEGYTRYSVAYDDSLTTNSAEEIDLRFYSNSDSIYRYDGCHYFLRHGDELLLYPSEKDDSLEALSTYLSQPDVHTFLLTSLSKRGIVPIFFITSGFSNDNADKGLRCVASSVSNIKGASLPGHGYSVSENNDIETHNFDKDYPYWFLKWIAVNPVGQGSILGTFMIKHIDNRGVETYIPTNNYFTVFVDGNGRARANYIEDTWYCRYNSLYVESHTGKPHNFGGTLYMGAHSFQEAYSAADLLATLLALFGVLERYTSPRTEETTYYTISNSDKANLKQTAASSISYSAVYTVDLNESKTNDINKKLKCGDVYLSDFYNIMKSNNLLMLSDKQLTYSQEFTFSPIKDFVPDFSLEIYLALISPEGDLEYRAMPRIDGSDDLYIWNIDNKCYEPYTLNTSHRMYKYAKFRKIRNCHNALDQRDDSLLTSNGLNPHLYDHSKEQVLLDFTKAVFNLDKIQQTKINIKHSLHKGLYTPNKSRRNGVIDFRFYHVDENNRYELKSLRAITNVATVPKVFDGTNQGSAWVIDPTLRL